MVALHMSVVAGCSNGTIHLTRLPPQPSPHFAAGQGHAAVHGGPAHGDQQLPASHLQRPDNPGAERCAAQACAPLSPVPPAVGSGLNSLRSGLSSLPVLPNPTWVQDGVFRAYAAVFDGHNGASAADHAADRLHHVLATENALRTCTGAVAVQEIGWVRLSTLAGARLRWCACLPANIHGRPRACSKQHPSQHGSCPACPALPIAGEGPPATAIQEEERVAAALVHSFEAVDREIMTRCRVEGTKGGATGLVVLRIGGPVVSNLSPMTHASPETHLSPKAHVSQPRNTTAEAHAMRASAADSSSLPCNVRWRPCSSHAWSSMHGGPPLPQATSCMRRTAATRAR